MYVVIYPCESQAIVWAVSDQVTGYFEKRQHAAEAAALGQ